MRFTEILGIAAAVSMDSLAVAVAAGLSQRGLSFARAARLALSFGCAQASMIAIGWLVGRYLHLLARASPWIACVLLGWVGARMIASAAHGERRGNDDPTHAASLLVLSLGTSLDGFAVGVPLAGLGASLSSLVAIVGAVVTAFALAGALLAARVGRLWGRRAEFAGGVALCFIGARILFLH
jgi:putative Mn2+ efflux pump MntP